MSKTTRSPIPKTNTTTDSVEMTENAQTSSDAELVAANEKMPQPTKVDKDVSSLAQCLISFGSNLGDRQGVIAEAARRVVASPDVQAFSASRLFETPPIGGPGGQEPFLNAVAALETTAPASQILLLLQRIENELGRERRYRWDARRIDLDVVLYGQLVGNSTTLTVPHPRYTARQFVLQPACDVAAHYRDPRFGWTLGELAKHLSAGSASMALVGTDEATRNELCQRLQQDHSIRAFPAQKADSRFGVTANVPLSGRAATNEDPATFSPQSIGVNDEKPWISAFVPVLPSDCSLQSTSAANLPRLIARMRWATPQTRWPEPHFIWPSKANWPHRSQWPEYRLEIDDLQWAASEIASALDSMRCPLRPVCDDGNWWKD